MKLQFKGQVTEVFVTEKGAQYLTFMDIETGGAVKVNMGSVHAEIEPGQFVQADLEVTGRSDKSGGIYLGFRSGGYKKLTVTIS